MMHKQAPNCLERVLRQLKFLRTQLGYFNHLAFQVELPVDFNCTRRRRRHAEREKNGSLGAVRLHRPTHQRILESIRCDS